MTHTATAPRSSIMPMCIIALLFFIFGFVTWLNGALIPFLQVVCQLTETQALMIASCFYFAYVVMALPMAMILEKVGYQSAMVLGLSIIALGLLGFIPAALLQEFCKLRRILMWLTLAQRTVQQPELRSWAYSIKGPVSWPQCYLPHGFWVALATLILPTSTTWPPKSSNCKLKIWLIN